MLKISKKEFCSIVEDVEDVVCGVVCDVVVLFTVTVVVTDVEVV